MLLCRVVCPQIWWIKRSRYLGFFFETLDLDDFSGSFCQKQIKYPLLVATVGVGDSYNGTRDWASTGDSPDNESDSVDEVEEYSGDGVQEYSGSAEYSSDFD